MAFSSVVKARGLSNNTWFRWLYGFAGKQHPPGLLVLLSPVSVLVEKCLEATEGPVCPFMASVPALCQHEWSLSAQRAGGPVGLHATICHLCYYVDTCCTRPRGLLWRTALLCDHLGLVGGSYLGASADSTDGNHTPHPSLQSY